MKKKLITLLPIIFFVLTFPVVAEESVSISTGVENKIQLRNEIRNEIKEVRQENKEERKNLLENLKNKISGIKNTIARIVEGVVSQNTGSSLIINKDGKTYTVNVTSNTVLKRRFWGNATLAEITAGHKVNIWGKFTDTDQSVIDARMIRDLSIQKRFGVFIGTIKTIVGNVLTMDTNNRGTQTVTVSTNTKFSNRKEQAIVQTDVLVGHRIRVKGMWDNVNNAITEVTHVKDFALPVIATPTVKVD